MAGAGVTATATRATLPVLRALLDQARRKDFRSGVLGVRARPEWTGTPTFTHTDVPVRVVPCVSALAVREALLDRVRDQWLVVLTDRPDDDLGAESIQLSRTLVLATDHETHRHIPSTQLLEDRAAHAAGTGDKN